MSNIDWSKLVTRAELQKAADERKLLAIQDELLSRRAVADTAIAPLQYAVELDDATEQEVAKLKAWKKYVLALSRIPGQEGYPASINWPIQPSEV